MSRPMLHVHINFLLSVLNFTSLNSNSAAKVSISGSNIIINRGDASVDQISIKMFSKLLLVV